MIGKTSIATARTQSVPSEGSQPQSLAISQRIESERHPASPAIS